MDPDVSLDGPLSLAEALNALDPLADEDAFRVLLALHNAGEDGLAVDELADRLDRNAESVRKDVDRLSRAGVAEERMACLVEECGLDGSGRYEVSEFGRLVLDEGVVEMLREADGFAAP